MATSKADTEKVRKDCSAPEGKDVPADDKDVSKGHRSQLEGAPTGQSQNNLSVKINIIIRIIKLEYSKNP